LTLPVLLNLQQIRLAPVIAKTSASQLFVLEKATQEMQDIVFCDERLVQHVIELTQKRELGFWRELVEPPRDVGNIGLGDLARAISNDFVGN
jgi:hypothetical protein